MRAVHQRLTITDVSRRFLELWEMLTRVECRSVDSEVVLAVTVESCASRAAHAGEVVSPVGLAQSLDAARFGVSIG